MPEEKKPYVGIIECPLHRGYVRFEFTPEDTVLDLKRKVSEVWGPARSKLKPWPEMGRRSRRFLEGGFMETGAWSVLCQNEDGAYSVLRDEDSIPTSPPASKGPHHESMLYGSGRREVGDKHVGLIHIFDMEEEFPLVFHFDEDYVDIDPDQYNVKLLALVAITGG